MKNDRLSDALRRGDPAEGQPEGHTDEARKAALLARCAAEPIAELTGVLRAAQKVLPGKTRWALPALAGAGVLTAAALYGAMAWFGASNPTLQTVPVQMANASPRPSATPAPRKTAMVPTPRPTWQENVTGQAMTPPKPKTHRDTAVADSAPTGRGTKQRVSVRLTYQNDALSPAPVKAIVRANRKKKAAEPRLIADTTKSQAASALPKISEPVVERVIIEQDATAIEPTPPITSVAIAINGRAESVIISRAAEPVAN